MANNDVEMANNFMEMANNRYCNATVSGPWSQPPPLNSCPSRTPSSGARVVPLRSRDAGLSAVPGAAAGGWAGAFLAGSSAVSSSGLEVAQASCGACFAVLSPGGLRIDHAGQLVLLGRQLPLHLSQRGFASEKRSRGRRPPARDTSVGSFQSGTQSPWDLSRGSGSGTGRAAGDNLDRRNRWHPEGKLSKLAEGELV